MTGALLLVLFVAECLTPLNMGRWLTRHVFLGALLTGPVGLNWGQLHHLSYFLWAAFMLIHLISGPDFRSVTIAHGFGQT